MLILVSVCLAILAGACVGFVVGMTTSEQGARNQWRRSRYCPTCERSDYRDDTGLPQWQ